MTTAKKEDIPLNDQEIVYRFQQMREAQMAYTQKIAELQGDIEEHRIVVETLSKTPKDRKCFRLVGDVLMERTVAEILPAVEQNKAQIEMMHKQLSTKLEEHNKQLTAFQEKHKIRVRN
eukprot:m.240544 g.240544  ORF g.240544 m.240544 type:complete len:119 (-) comp15393_c0_seq1:95-451(-)